MSSPKAKDLNRLVVLLGASGSGKTTIAGLLASKCPGLIVEHFDSAGVSSQATSGSSDPDSPANRQRRALNALIGKIAKEVLPRKPALLAVQARPSFISAACEASGVREYKIVLLDCSSEECQARLKLRDQEKPLAESMHDWPAFLKSACEESPQCTIINNTNLSVDTCLARVEEEINNFLKGGSSNTSSKTLSLEEFLDYSPGLQSQGRVRAELRKGKPLNVHWDL